jgi:hypothetical protein
MDNIYICGDSFAVPDREYGPCWVDMLPGVTNLAQVCSSNFMIYQQVEQAIDNQADYIIVLFTSSLRSELVHKDNLVPFSWLALDNTTPFNPEQLSILRNYYTLVDIDIEIKKNKIIIESVLQLLIDSQIPFKFDQGGFEHPSYGGTNKYFAKYEKYRSQHCLWDYAVIRTYRPYYHITDSKIHTQVANYYNGLFNENNLGIR